MLIRTKPPVFVALIFLIAVGFSRSAVAQDELGDGEGEEAVAAEEELDEAPLLKGPGEVRHGMGLRLRYIFVPQGLLEIFMEEAASGVSRSGFGLDYVRRKKEFEFSVVSASSTLAPDDGYYIERGGSTMELGSVDFIEFQDLSWFTIDASFVYHHTLSELVALRYGGGLGFSVVTGKVISHDAACIGGEAQTDCAPIPGVQDIDEDFFRYPPVLNLIGGVQITPGDNLAINVELGMRTVFYTGVGVQYFF